MCTSCPSWTRSWPVPLHANHPCSRGKAAMSQRTPDPAATDLTERASRIRRGWTHRVSERRRRAGDVGWLRVAALICGCTLEAVAKISHPRQRRIHDEQEDDAD